MTKSGPKEDLVLAGHGAPRQFSYRLTLSDGLTPIVTTRGDLEILRGASRRFVIPRAVLFEERNPAVSVAAKAYELEKAGTNVWRVKLDANGEWIKAKDRSWPVVVDPLISIDSTGPNRECQRYVVPTDQLGWNRCTGGAWYPGPHGSGPWSSSLAEIGLHDEIVGRLTYRFPLPGVLTEQDVLEARLRLDVSGVGSSSVPARNLQLHRMTGNGDWGYLHSDAAWTLAAPADVRPAVSGSMSFDVAPEVRGWIANQVNPSQGFANHGVLLKFDHALPGWNDGGDGQNPNGTYEPYWDSWPSSWGRAKVATSNHADATKRPVLDIYSAPPAQAGSEVASPTEGKHSSRFVELYAKSPSANVSSVKFEYVAGDSREWQPIPLDALRFADSGTAPSTAEISVVGSGTNRSSESLIWDLHKTPGGQVDGPVHVRAMLDSGSGSGGGLTPVRNFRVDRKNPDGSSSVGIGPGSVDLLTGDLVVTETDAEVSAFIEDLKLTRTYHSRGGTPRTSDMFGPGWISGFETDGGDMPYRSIYNFTEVKETEEIVDWVMDDSVFWETYDFNDLAFEPVYETTRFETTYAVVEKTDGSKITFTKSGSSWTAPADRPDLKLDPDGANLKVTDADGGITVFVPDVAGSPNFRPSSYKKAGAPNSTTMEYEVVAGRKRLVRIFAPRLNGVTCSGSGSSWTSGCRALQLHWVSMTVAGKTEWRVGEVGLRAADPSNAATGSVHWLTKYEYYPDGRLKSARDTHGLIGAPTEYVYDSSGRMTSYRSRGERPWTFTYQAVPGDDGAGRVRSVTRKTPADVDATTTLVYDVPLSGPAAPNDLSATTVATWGQGDKPRTGTAVFPPDSVPGSGTPTSWERAEIHYLGAHGKTVNVADAEHNITTTEYDHNGNAIRELTARNRERALEYSGATATRAGQLSTIRVYRTNGVDLAIEHGPERRIRKPDGSYVLGHERTRYGYDNGKPTGAEFDGDLHLVTEKRVDAHLTDNTSLGEEVTTYEYSVGTNIRGWRVRKPLKVTVGEGAEAASTTYAFDPDYPLLTEKRLPKATGSDSHATQYHYYGIGSPPAWCTSGAGLADVAAAGGLLCAAVPAAQPSSGPSRLGSYHRYQWLWDEIELREATSPSTVATSPVRTTSIGRDYHGREVSRSVSSSVGRAIPVIERSYHPLSGRLEYTTSLALGPIASQTFRRVTDDNGRLASYVHNDGQSTYSYDINGRVTSVQDDRGTRALSYDGRDEVSTVTDSTLPGPMHVTRDADGEVIQQDLPDALRMTRDLNEAGDPTAVRWEKTESCSASCVLVESEVERDALGRVGKHDTGTMSQAFSYDSLGRLGTANEVRGVVCTSRSYGFDKNSNRTSLSQTVSAPTGACGSGSSVTKGSSYDGADRLNNLGYVYDALGRTTAIPAADAPRGAALVLTYDVDDLVASISDASRSQSVTRNSTRRLHAETSVGPGLSSSVGVLRYDDDEDQPVARTSGSDWERYVRDADDTQIATVTDDGDIEWLLTDVSGSVVGTVESGSSSLTHQVDFDEFGGEAWSAGAAGPKGLTHGWLGGHGKQTSFDAGGLVYMGARVYNPVTGRFLQVDAVEGGSANAYDYANQDPLNSLDLDGQFAWFAPAGIFGARVAVPWVSRGVRAVFQRAPGPSGKPKIHHPRYNTRKGAQQAAKQAGRGAPPKNHSWDRKGHPPHVHRGDGVKDGVHHRYPKRRGRGK